MIKALNKKPVRSSIGWGIVMVLVAVLIIAVFAGDLAAVSKGPAPVTNYNTVDELEGEYIEAEINFLWEPFCYVAEQDETEEDAEEIMYMAAILPLDNMDNVLDVPYIAVSFKGGLIDDAEDLYKRGNLAFNTWDAADLGASMTVKGMVELMDGEEQAFFNEMLIESEMTDYVDNVLILRTGTAPGGGSFTAYSMTAVAALLMIIAIFRIYKAFSGGYQKDIRAYCEASGNPEGTLSALEEFQATTLPLPGGIHANARWLLFTEGLNARVVDTSNVRWVYTSAVRHRTNGIPTGTTYSVVIRTADGKMYNVPVRREAEAKAVAGALFPVLPSAVFGYSDQLESLYKQNGAAFADIAANQHQRAEENAVQ